MKRNGQEQVSKDSASETSKSRKVDINYKVIHARAENVLKDLKETILSKDGNEKLEELYAQVDSFESRLAAEVFFSEGIRKAIRACIESMENDQDKNYSKFKLISLLAETFDTIDGQFSDRPFYQERLSDYEKGIVYAYNFLDDGRSDNEDRSLKERQVFGECSKILGDTYLEYLVDN